MVGHILFHFDLFIFTQEIVSLALHLAYSNCGFIVRLMMNYEYINGDYCVTQDVWSHLESEKENVDFDCTSKSKSLLGRIIQDIWGSHVKNVKKLFHT